MEVSYGTSSLQFHQNPHVVGLSSFNILKLDRLDGALEFTGVQVSSKVFRDGRIFHSEQQGSSWKSETIPPQALLGGGNHDPGFIIELLEVNPG